MFPGHTEKFLLQLSPLFLSVLSMKYKIGLWEKVEQHRMQGDSLLQKVRTVMGVHFNAI